VSKGVGLLGSRKGEEFNFGSKKMDSFEKMYSVKEAAAVLAVSPDTVLRLIRRKRLNAWLLPAERDGRKRRYQSFRLPHGELLSFMKRNAV
jgi:excisionase family DNA binding protein